MTTHQRKAGLGFCSQHNAGSLGVLIAHLIELISSSVTSLWPFGIDGENHLRPPFLEQDTQAVSQLNNSNNISSTYYLSGPVQSAFVHSFIHSFIHQICIECLPCSRPHTRLWRCRGWQSCWMQKPVLHPDAALAFIPLSSIFPKKDDSILTSKETSSADLGHMRGKQAQPPSWTPSLELSVWPLGHLLCDLEQGASPLCASVSSATKGRK